MLQPGDKAPSVYLKTLDGPDIALAEMWNRRQVLLVFLRHLG
jgi:peroxiredoxin